MRIAAVQAIELTQAETKILADLVDSRMGELHPEIRRSRVSRVTDELKHDLEDMQRLLSKLEAAVGQN